MYSVHLHTLLPAAWTIRLLRATAARRAGLHRPHCTHLAHVHVCHGATLKLSFWKKHGVSILTLLHDSKSRSIIRLYH